jgi:uncharacterized protein (DUF2141 family)
MSHRRSHRTAPYRRPSAAGIMVLLCLLLALLPAPGEAQQKQDGQVGRLTVIVTGIESDVGQVRIALFDSEDAYGSAKKPYRACSVGIKSKRAQCLFADLPYKVYAFRLYHDANGNGKFDRDSGGMPMEAYAFSNNAKGYMGPAKWSDAKFSLQSKSMRMEIILD